ncbi:copper ion binding protein, putative [Ricinus communis]|uniref:Copper ion binding protein, putative n=1 Tax=Ricinus communis TaxID=3988 RepID=B9SI97_RICCO|nr:copper ion binding protein, putative [Ricinus communis]
MASSQLVVFAIVAIILPAVAMATDFLVGDDKGWTVGVNCTEWSNGKAFYAGDRLVEKCLADLSVGEGMLQLGLYCSPHNVYRVNGTSFKECNPSGILMNSGNDTVILDLPGKKWFICGVSSRCEVGQKLVTARLEPTPATESN